MTLAALLLAWAVALGVRLSTASAPYDDAFITFRYARNLVEGQGFAYNAGERYGGTTSPAYALALAGASKATGGVDPATIANWFSALAIATAAWWAFRLVAEDFGLLAGLVAGGSTALNPMLLSAWGGEWLVAVAWMAVGFCAYRLERFILASVAVSAAVLFRSEAAIGAAVVLAHLAWTRRRGAVAPLALSAAIGLSWAAVSLAAFGYIVPATLGAKLAHARSGLFGTLLGGFYQGARQFVSADPLMLAVPVLAWHGGLLAAVKGRVWHLFGLWVVAHTLFYTILRLPFYHWYLVPIAFAISVSAGIGVSAVQLYARAVFRGRSPGRLAAAVSLVLLVGASLVAEARSSRDWLRAKPDFRERAYNELGSWLAASTPRDASVAYLEIGRIGYFSRRRIVDLMGLVTPGVAEHVGNQDLLWAIYAYKPDYYVTSSMFTWAGTLSGEPWFENAYEPVRTTKPPGLDTIITVYRKRQGAVFPEPPEIEGAQLRRDAIVGEILPGTPHGQTFVATRAGLAEVALQLATMARPNRGGMIFRLEERQGSGIVAEEHFRMEGVVDNAWRRFRFGPLPDSGGKSYRLTLTALDAAPGNAITIWYSTGDSYREGERLVGGVPAPGDLALKLYYASPADAVHGEAPR